jgi:hypothetical protein
VAKIAQALDVDENEALLAANLMPTYGAPPQPQIQKTVNQSAETETVSADWWCQFKTGDISLRTVVKPVNLNTFLVSIKQEKETSAEQTPQAQIRWFLNQKEQATVPASKAGSTFALREGEHEFRCQWENREEVILHIRIGVGVPQHSSPSGSGL